MQDMDQALKLMPGKKKLNLHASYAVFENSEFIDRNRIEPKHFAKWVAFAKERNMGIDFNPTFFSHDKIKNGLTLSSPHEETRKFWIEHGKACVRISQYFAEQTGIPCVMNIWTGDGYKDIPADRMGPCLRYKDSIEQILSEPHDKNLVKPCVESKVFGIGVEAFTAGSAEFALTFAATHDGCLPLMDNGHYHPTEVVSDKIPALLCFSLKLRCILPVQSAGTATMLYCLTMKQRRWQKKSYVTMRLTAYIWHLTILMQASIGSLHGRWDSAAGKRLF